MIDMNLNNNRKNAELLLKGLWYAELPDLLDIEELTSSLDDVFSEINRKNVREFQQASDNFITEWKYITSPPYIRSPGVEAVSFFDFKKNKSLREMQIPHLLHYISFMYNTMFMFPQLFEPLYIDPANRHFVENSNSYLVFEDSFLIYSYEDDEDWAVMGTFTTKNNKINNSTVLSENKRRMLAVEADYGWSYVLIVSAHWRTYTAPVFYSIPVPLASHLLMSWISVNLWVLFFPQASKSSLPGRIPAQKMACHFRKTAALCCAMLMSGIFLSHGDWLIWRNSRTSSTASWLRSQQYFSLCVSFAALLNIIESFIQKRSLELGPVFPIKGVNLRPPVYELMPVVQSVDFKCFPALFVPEIFQIQEVIYSPLCRDFSCSGSEFGSGRYFPQNLRRYKTKIPSAPTIALKR